MNPNPSASCQAWPKVKERQKSRTDVEYLSEYVVEWSQRDDGCDEMWSVVNSSSTRQQTVGVAWQTGVLGLQRLLVSLSVLFLLARYFLEYSVSLHCNWYAIVYCDPWCYTLHNLGINLGRHPTWTHPGMMTALRGASLDPQGVESVWVPVPCPHRTYFRWIERWDLRSIAWMWYIMIRVCQWYEHVCDLVQST